MSQTKEQRYASKGPRKTILNIKSTPDDDRAELVKQLDYLTDHYGLDKTAVSIIAIDRDYKRVAKLQQKRTLHKGVI